MKYKDSQELFQFLRDDLSTERINAYRLHANDGDIDLLGRYFWNVALGESLYPVLNTLEIALRNEMDRIMRRTFHNRWLDLPDRTLLEPVEVATIEEAKQKLLASGRPAIGGKLIAELSFGFWTSLFNVRYETKVWRPIFADHTSDRAFRLLPRRFRTRKTLSSRLTEIRRLRNRIFHHEPIWRQSDLPVQHQKICEVIYWISPALYETVHLFDRFPAVHSHTPNHYREMISTLFQ